MPTGKQAIHTTMLSRSVLYDGDKETSVANAKTFSPVITPRISMEDALDEALDAARMLQERGTSIWEVYASVSQMF